jgi:hypothetical protein
MIWAGGPWGAECRQVQRPCHDSGVIQRSLKKHGKDVQMEGMARTARWNLQKYQLNPLLEE